MSKEQLQALLGQFAQLAHALAAANIATFEAALDHLVALLKDTSLPAKDDGTPWSDEDLRAAARTARAGFQATLDRSGQ